jgi:hypothetical protein
MGGRLVHRARLEDPRVKDGPERTKGTSRKSRGLSHEAHEAALKPKKKKGASRNAKAKDAVGRSG